ncbi:MAG TPA: glycosyltransferase family 1 protein [Kiritimatiellae bacterium]|nr:glycosyltransferase family 1 protein [Kiritimatiellia bacterium]
MKAEGTKVLHVFAGLSTEGVVGGAERAILDLLLPLEHRWGYECHVAVLGRKDPQLREPLPPGRIHYLNLSYSLGLGFHIVTAARRLRAYLRRINPALVHSHLWLADVVTALAVAGQPIVHVVHLHDTREWMAAGDWRCRLRRALYRLAAGGARTRYVACAEAVRRYVAGRLAIPAERITVVRYGIPVERWRAERSVPVDGARMHIVGCAGRLVPEKGQDVLIRAAAKLARGGPKVVLRLAGGMRRTGADFVRLARRLGLADQVEFLGRVREMRAFYDGLDVYVLPSRSSEGLPLSILEAMAMQRPVVATDVGGVREAITSGEEGYVVPAGDADALGAALERLLRDPSGAARMGDCGRRRVQRDFTLERMADEVAQFYARG